MKGVNFGAPAQSDKIYAPMPNVGNRCASPHCPTGHIGEGEPARFAHNNSTLWCHKACADAWEAREPGYTPAGATPAVDPAAPVEQCKCPHPEDYTIVCTKSAEQHHYHNDGQGRSWYAQPAQAQNLKMLAEQYFAARQPVAAPVTEGTGDDQVSIFSLQEGQTVQDVPVSADDEAVEAARKLFRDGYPIESFGHTEESLKAERMAADQDANEVTDDQLTAMQNEVANQGPDSSPDIEAIVAKHAPEVHDHAVGEDLPLRDLGSKPTDSTAFERAVADAEQRYADYLNDDGSAVNEADDEPVVAIRVVGTQQATDKLSEVELSPEVAAMISPPIQYNEHRHAYLIRSIAELTSIFAKHKHTLEYGLLADLYEWKRCS